MAMRNGYLLMAAVGCILASLCAGAQAGGGTRKVVLPSPQLIHCRAAECSQLWKQDSSDGGIVYPAQVLTDFVNGEIVGLTAVYDKSVTTEELCAAINALYSKWTVSGLTNTWRVEPEQLMISVSDGSDGAKQVIYLKIGGNYASHVPSAHLNFCAGKPLKKPPYVP
jgi:hypothetical protein